MLEAQHLFSISIGPAVRYTPPAMAHRGAAPIRAIISTVFFHAAFIEEAV